MTSAIQPSMQSGTGVSCFEWEGRTPRVVFGFGRARTLSAELARLGATRTLALVTPSGALRYQSWLQTVPSIVGQFAGAQPHCPEEVVRAALDQFRALGCDSAVAIGGGSTLGLGKVIAAETGSSFIAVPTTMSGSEMTALYGVKRGSEKRTQTDERARAKTVIYDAEVAAGLPMHQCVTTSMNCLAHCIEAFYTQRSQALTRAVAELGVRELAAALPVIIDEPADSAARQRLLQAGMIGGWLVGTVGIALHHKICHIIGGHYDIAHAESNSAVLPQVAAFYEQSFGEHRAALLAALRSSSVGRGVFELARRSGAPLSLAQLGVDPSTLDAMAAETVRSGVWSPIPITEADVRALLQRAYEGRMPD